MAIHIRRREFIVTLGGAAAAWPVLARAQQRTILPQVGILDPGIPQHFETFRRTMRGLGYVEGNSISYIYRTAEGRAEPVSQLASELVALKPDVIVAVHSMHVRALKEATSTIPIVFVLGDAITAGLVNNLAHPRENLTGLSFLNTELSAKRLELLFEMLPNIHRIAVLRDLNTPRIWAEETEEASRRLGLALQLLEVADPGTFESAFEAAVNAHAEALDVLGSAFFLSHKARLTELAAKYRLPTMYEHDDFVRTGGLMAYGPSIPDLMRRVATYVDKILKGAKPGDLPIEQPTKFDLVINLKIAKTLGLTIPPTLLARAEEVIE
jgi:putative ABC transport system substrate-binding protein